MMVPFELMAPAWERLHGAQSICGSQVIQTLTDFPGAQIALVPF
jgi:hypothetical protein